jgi:hypothetical protein
LFAIFENYEGVEVDKPIRKQNEPPMSQLLNKSLGFSNPMSLLLEIVF